MVRMTMRTNIIIITKKQRTVMKTNHADGAVVKGVHRHYVDHVRAVKQQGCGGQHEDDDG